MRNNAAKKSRCGLLVLIAILITISACGGKQTPVIDVTGPTVVGFFPPLSEEELQRTPAVSHALAFLQFALNDAEDCLAALAPTIRMEETSELKLRLDGKRQTIEIPQKDGLWVGVVLLQPGQEPRIVHAVGGPASLQQTLVTAVAEYFSSPECAQ
jgi:hypothetical protein